MVQRARLCAVPKSRRLVEAAPCQILMLAFAVIALTASNTAYAQAIPGGKIERVLTTDDDWQIYITFYPGPRVGEKDNLSKETPVVLLLHGDKENRLAWDGERGLAPRLQHEGYAVISVDLRKHGQSANIRVSGDSPAGGKNTEGTNLQASDYQNMVDYDLEAVKKFIYEQHQAKALNMNKMAIIAAESSCGVAICFAVADWNKAPYDDAPTDEAKTRRGQDVRAIVLLSPTAKVKGLSVKEA